MPHMGLQRLKLLPLSGGRAPSVYLWTSQLPADSPETRRAEGCVVLSDLLKVDKHTAQHIELHINAKGSMMVPVSSLADGSQLSVMAAGTPGLLTVAGRQLRGTPSRWGAAWPTATRTSTGTR